MLKFILHRALATVPVLFLLSVIVFSLIHLIPGDPVLIMLGEENDPQALEALRRELGIDRPIVEQFLSWLWRLLQGDFGRSLRSHQPVLEAVGERLPVTIELTLLAMLISSSIALPAGVIAALRRNSGLDVLSRLMWGARVSLQVGVIAVSIALLSGTVLGMLSGYIGGILDNWLMRLMDALLAFPVLVLALALAAILSPSLSNVMLAIGVVGVPTYARLVRGQVLSVREWEFVQAARAVGGSDGRILLRHVLPNIAAPIIVEASLHIAAATLAEAGLSFLGLGVQPPTPSWGAMLNVGRGYLEIAPWMAMAPGAAIFLTVLGFNFLGDGVRDALDPRLKQL